MATPKSHLASFWNRAVAYIDLLHGDVKLSSGSCFFWGFNDRTFLVTNWHNLSGRNPFTNQPLSPTAGLPDRVSAMVYRVVSEPDAEGMVQLAYVPIAVPLLDGDRRLWLEHPSFGSRVDVAALDVTDTVKDFSVMHANQIENDAVLDVRPSQDVFVVGFPFGQIANAPAPIWKRGTIALDPAYDPEGLPKMFIDTATRQGMSGSVVVARHILVNRPYQKKDGTTAPLLLYANFDVVAGIYSGRHYPDLEKAQLGIVWKRSAIEQVVAQSAVTSNS